MINLEYSYFQRKVLDLTGIDLSLYKSDQMKRRLNMIMARSGAQNLFEYYRILNQNADKLQEFRDFVTINVSEFFRVPEKFDCLRTHIFPELMANRRNLRIWSAGCSNGAEPYSLAIMLSEMAPLGQWQILATDIDTTVLARARAGIYQPADLANVKTGLIQRYFVAVGNAFRVVDRIRNRVQFKPHDLLRDDYEKDFDLIVCRHVVIYFTESAKNGIFRKFNLSLRVGGVLFIGGTEVMKAPQELGYSNISVSFYRKVEDASLRR